MSGALVLSIDLVREYTERQSFYLVAGIFLALSINQHARQFWDFGYPASVFFPFQLDAVLHNGLHARGWFSGLLRPGRHIDNFHVSWMPSHLFC